MGAYSRWSLKFGLVEIPKHTAHVFVRSVVKCVKLNLYDYYQTTYMLY